MDITTTRLGGKGIWLMLALAGAVIGCGEITTADRPDAGDGNGGIRAQLGMGGRRDGSGGTRGTGGEAVMGVGGVGVGGITAGTGGAPGTGGMYPAPRCMEAPQVDPSPCPGGGSLGGIECFSCTFRPGTPDLGHACTRSSGVVTCDAQGCAAHVDQFCTLDCSSCS